MVFLCCSQVDTKESRFDLVTEVDKACEDLLRSQVQVWWDRERDVWQCVCCTFFFTRCFISLSVMVLCKYMGMMVNRVFCFLSEENHVGCSIYSCHVCQIGFQLLCLLLYDNGFSFFGVVDSFPTFQAKFPHHFYLGEETATEQELERLKNGVNEADWTWIVDPIDGTLNFVRPCIILTGIFLPFHK